MYLDLERDADRRVLTEPDLYLDEQVGKLVILDEVQQMPDLFKTLRGQIDMRRRKGARTGSSSCLGLHRMCFCTNQPIPLPGVFAISTCRHSCLTKSARTE